MGSRIIRWMTVLAVAGVMLQGASAWASAISTPMSVTSFGHIVVDDADQHVLISSPSDNEIAVYDFSGNLVTTITGIPGADGMVIRGSSLYVAESTVGTIEEIDLATLTAQGTVASGLTDPRDLVFAGGELWTETDAGGGYYRLTSISLAGNVTTFPASDSTEFTQRVLATSAGTPNMLYAGDSITSGSLYALDVSSGSPVVVKSAVMGVSSLTVSPDGTHVITNGDSLGAGELTSSTLIADGVAYNSTSGQSANVAALAVSPGDGGLVATAGAVDPAPNIGVFKLGSPSPIFTASMYNWEGLSAVPSDGLALTGDGSTLFAVGGVDDGAGSLRLWRFGLGSTSTTSYTTVAAGQVTSNGTIQVSLKATVTPTDSGGTVTFYNYGTGAPISGCSSVPLSYTPHVWTATCTTTSLARGQTMAFAYYSGDSSYGSSFGTTSMNVAGGNYTWSGAGPSYDGQGFNYLSTPMNWVGGAAPSGTVGTLTFPNLSSTCSSQPAPDACYAPYSDSFLLTAAGVVINSDTAYDISGYGFSLGTAGLTVESPSGNGNPPTIQTPMTLQAPQTWTIDEGPTVLSGNVMGAQQLTVDFNNGSIEPVGGINAGNITATGTGGFYLNGGLSLNWPGSATTTVANGAGIEADQRYNDVGGLNVGAGGWLSAGGIRNGGGALSVGGDLTFSGNSELDLAVDAPGTTAGVDYSQITVAGNVNLGGAQLNVLQGVDSSGYCDELNPGDTLTLVSASGTITGTFSNYANGASVDIVNNCDNGTLDAAGTLSYSGNAVTLTITEPGDAGNPGSPPELTPPSISGTPMVGQTLQVDPGTWQGATSFEYVWWACDDTGNCSQIPNAASSTFQLTPAQLGDQIGAMVTAVGPAGTNYDYTNLTDAVAPPPVPAISSMPTISEADVVGDVLSATTGTWTNAPTSYQYQWERCSSTGTACAAIAGASSSTYSLMSGDAGATVAVQVTATNLGGKSSPAQSTVTAVVTTAGPTTAAITTALRTVLTPAGKAASLSSVLSHHGYTFNFQAPGSGKLAVTWTASVKHKTVTIAKGAATAPGPGRVKVFVRLTGAGASDLKRHAHLRIRCSVLFTATGLQAINASSSFTLRGQNSSHKGHATARSSSHTAAGSGTRAKPRAGSIELRLMNKLFGRNHRVTRARTHLPRSVFRPS